MASSSSTNAYSDLMNKLRSWATQRSSCNGVFPMESEKDIAERKFAEEHPELGEVCL